MGKWDIYVSLQHGVREQNLGLWLTSDLEYFNTLFKKVPNISVSERKHSVTWLQKHWQAFPCCNVHFSVREQNKRVSHIRIWPQTAEEEAHCLPVEEGEDGGETNTFYSNVSYTDIFIFRNTNACDQQPMQIFRQVQWYLHFCWWQLKQRDSKLILGSSPSADDDHLMWLIEPARLLHGLWCETALSTTNIVCKEKCFLDTGEEL